MTKPGQVIIVGGGPVGSVLAMFLARRGLRVDIYDRGTANPADNPARPSVNLTLCERGLRVLRAIGVEAQVREVTVPLYGRQVHGRDGGSSFQPYGNRREALYCISRNRLHDLLLSCAQQQPGVSYHPGQRCLDLDLGTNTLTFQDVRTGEVVRRRAERIVGADGAFSAVRQRLQRTSRFDYSQHYFPHGYKELTVPLLPDGRPPFERNAIHFWPDGEVGLLGMPNVDGSLMLMLQLPFEDSACSFEALRTPADVSRLFEERFPRLLPLMPRLGEEFFSRQPNTLVTIRCSTWFHQDKVVLVGDAAHSLVPFYGQGVNSGFEDCATLDACMERSRGDWGAAFREYFQLRKPNMDLIAELAQHHFWELRDRLGDSRFQLRKKLERRLNHLYPDRYLPLYSMVAFTSMTYVEAWAQEQRQQALVEQLMRMEGIEQRWDGPEVEAAIHRLMARPSHVTDP